MPLGTPMMQQYFAVKEQNQDCILFFRLGDFYEMFGEDAKLVSKELDLTLTTRDRTASEEERVPMCGVPYHSSDAYIARLIAKGYKVAICEQTEDPKAAKGLVKREVIRVVTPGTVTDSSMLDERKNNFIAAVWLEAGVGALCFGDLSTGELLATCIQGEDVADRLCNELGRFSPSEALLSPGAWENEQVKTFLRERLHTLMEREDALFDPAAAAGRVQQQFAPRSPEELGLGEGSEAACTAVGALLQFLHQTQKTDLSYINTVEYYERGRFMELDYAARRSLELSETMRTGARQGSLLWAVDRTRTTMGGRLLRAWLERPLMNPVSISRRLTAVEELKKDSVALTELQEALRALPDMERLIGRVVYGSAGGRDLRSLSSAMGVLPKLRARLEGRHSARLRELLERMDPLEDVKDAIDRCLVDEPPFSVREGGLIREGYSDEVDRLKNIMTDGRGTVAAMEAAEREKTGIKNLKVGYNRVFGYYIEVSRSQTALVPDSYVRKQTTANSERYITQELKEMESTILGAQERVVSLEYDLFTQLRRQVAEQVVRVQQSAGAAAQLDVLCGFARLAEERDYCMPEVDYSDRIEIADGRHPVVEQMLKGSLFVPNDTTLYPDAPTMIITGPNMAGKSTYMRQVALITLLAQVGSFVPARRAHIGVVDRIFTRIGASDDLAAGQSTFMVEMTEVAEILKHATKKSLILLDEIGRGTSTFDGMAIARAVVEYAADPKRLGAKTLFSTHYHELTALDRELGGVKNYNIAVKKRGEDIIFLRKIIPGGADDSYGVEVARLAGVPERVIRRARTILRELEAGKRQEGPAVPAETEEPGQISLERMGENDLTNRLKALDCNALTPLEAMNLLYELSQQAKNL